MKARLLTDAYKQDTGADLLELRVAEDLVAVVAYDLPENVMLPERADVLQYGDERELLALALRQAREEDGLALERYELHGAPLYVLTGESFFTATHALWADRFSEQPAELGTLVGVPTRHIVVAHPIRDRGALTVIAQMLQLVARYFQRRPRLAQRRARTGSSTAAWSGCETWIDEQGPHLSPSPRFARVLEALAVTAIPSAGARTASRRSRPTASRCRRTSRCWATRTSARSGRWSRSSPARRRWCACSTRRTARRRRRSERVLDEHGLRPLGQRDRAGVPRRSRRSTRPRSC